MQVIEKDDESVQGILRKLSTMTVLFDRSKKYAKPVERRYGNPFGERAAPEQLERIRRDVVMALGSRYRAREYERRAGAGPNLKERAAELAYREFMEQ